MAQMDYSVEHAFVRRNHLAQVPAFHSINEIDKPADKRVYHNDDACAPGRDIPKNERRGGTGGYRLCKDCERPK